MYSKVYKENYYTIKNLVNKFKYKASVNSILDEKTKGEVFSDNPNNPSTVLIWDKKELLYIFGEIQDLAVFNINFKKFIKENITATGILVGFFPEKHWLSIANQIIEQDYLLNCFRWTSTFCQTDFYQFKNKFSNTLPKNFHLQRISKEILESNRCDELIEDILEYWKSTDFFLKKGIGFCLVHESKIISSVISCSVADNKYLEISINTYDEQQRNNYFATHCAITFIDYCILNNYLPVWETDWDNKASQFLGTKLGFIGYINENRYQFHLNRENNFLINLYCHLKEGKADISYIKTLIYKVLENTFSDINPKYLITISEMLVKCKIENQALLLLDKYLQIDNAKINEIKNNPSFFPLINKKDWIELFNKHYSSKLKQ